MTFPRPIFKIASGRGISCVWQAIAGRFFYALRSNLINLVLLAGLALIVMGCWRISEALALIVAGAFFVFVGVLLTLREMSGA